MSARGPCSGGGVSWTVETGPPCLPEPDESVLVWASRSRISVSSTIWASSACSTFATLAKLVVGQHDQEVHHCGNEDEVDRGRQHEIQVDDLIAHGDVDLQEVVLGLPVDADRTDQGRDECSVKLVTNAVKAVPMTTATDRSTILPRERNSLNPLSIGRPS